MPSPYKSVASLPRDAGGKDTLSAKDIPSPVVLNIRPYHISETIDGHVWTSDIALENVVSGNGINYIYLNELDNVVDISSATQSVLFVDPSHNGNDTIIGFKPLTDQLILEYDLQDSSSLSVSIQKTQGPCLTSKRVDCPATQIIFSNQDSVSLLNVSPEELKSESIQANPQAPISMRDLFEIDEINYSQLFNSLGIDFMQSLLAGIILGIFIELMNHFFSKISCSEKDKEWIKIGFGFLYVLYFGGIANVGIGIASTLLLSQVKLFSPETNNAINYFLTHALDYQDLSTIGTMKKVTKHLGMSTGSFFSSSAKNAFFKKKESVEPKRMDESELNLPFTRIE